LSKAALSVVLSRSNHEDAYGPDEHVFVPEGLDHGTEPDASTLSGPLRHSIALTSGPCARRVSETRRAREAHRLTDVLMRGAALEAEVLTADAWHGS
jgi:hypothetical protein